MVRSSSPDLARSISEMLYPSASNVLASFSFHSCTIEYSEVTTAVSFAVFSAAKAVDDITNKREKDRKNDNIFFISELLSFGIHAH